jgi:hypothetical protein
MAKKDTYNRVFPFKIRYQNKDIADEGRLNAFEKLVERGFEDLERAIGDVYNTENAVNSSLSNQPLYINSLGRAIGSMAEIIPPLSGIQPYSPALASRLAEATYNVIPHPDQVVKCEVGCKFDSLVRSDSTSRSCLKNRTAFYRINEGAQTGICQATDCPDWSGRAGRKIDTLVCDPNEVGNIYREYKIVTPPELRTVDTFGVEFYSNAGTNYDRYRIDTPGHKGFDDSNRSDPSKSWAVTTNSELAISGIGGTIKYEYPNLDTASTYIVVVEVPAEAASQIISVNSIPQAVVDSTDLQPTRVLIDLSSIAGSSRLLVTARPVGTGLLDAAYISQIWVIKVSQNHHRNYGHPLLLPTVLNDLQTGTEIPPNFLQLFDTDSSVNRIIDKVRVFSGRFNPKGGNNQNSHRDNFDVTIFGDQALEVDNNRYLGVTVGTSVATAVGSLLEAFIEHVSDESIHLSKEQVCELLADRSYCCDDRLKVVISSLEPTTRQAGASPSTYYINTYIYGGFPPYDVVIDWGDGSNDALIPIVSGVQTIEITEDIGLDKTPYQFSHAYSGYGRYNLTFDVSDNPDIFGCSASITSQVSPFIVGSAPDVFPEIRMDNFSDYPTFLFSNMADGYAFTETALVDWTSDPVYHTLTQVHNTDLEDGKTAIYSWTFDNPNGLAFQFYYENVSGVQGESLAFTAGNATLANNFIQQDSLALTLNGVSFALNTDYTVNWETGAVVLVGPGIAQAATVDAAYYHYYFAAALADVSGVNQWIALGSETSSTTTSGSVIALSDLTYRTDLNTIRFKVREL